MPAKKGPNSQWADWIAEEAELASGKGSRAADSYNKAARALRACPHLLNHPKEAKGLSGIGDKVVAIITRRMEKICRDEDIPFPRQVPLKEPQAGPSGTNSRRRKKPDALTAEELALDDPSEEELPVQAKKARATKPYTPKPRDGAWGILAALYSFCEPLDQKKFSSRETIIEASQKYCNSSYESDVDGKKAAWNSAMSIFFAFFASAILKKHQLVVVHATLRPMKYALSRAGFELATAIAATEGIPLIELVAEICAVEPPMPPVHRSPSPPTLLKRKSSVDASSLRWIEKVRTKSERIDLDDDQWEASLILGASQPTSSNQPQAASRKPATTKSHSAPQVPQKRSHADSVDLKVKRAATGALAHVYREPDPMPSTDSLGTLRFQFSYLDKNDVRVRTLREAEVRHTDEEDLFKVEYCTRQRLHPFKIKSIVQEARLERALGPEGATMMGWLRKEKTIPICPGFVEALASVSQPKPLIGRAMGADRLPKDKSTGSSRSKTKESSSRGEFGNPTVSVPRSGTHHDNSSLQTLPSTSSAPLTQPTPYTSLLQQSSNQKDEQARRPIDQAPRPRPRPSFATATTLPTGLAKPRASIGTMGMIAMTVQPETWPAGSYTISLIIDNREVKSKGDRAGIYNLCVTKAHALNKRESETIKVEQRALAVGDAIWIAVHKATGKEVVLDSIVERKRLDDLCASILDTRYHEQKARLMNSGLRDRIYLVEEFNSQANRAQFGKQIETSKVEMMIVSDCHLHETADWKASVDYLMMRTEVLNMLHKTIDLSVIPDRHIDRKNYLPLLTQLRLNKPDLYWVTSYCVFDSLNDKSSNLTINNIWARMINSVKGMSPEKVLDFVQRWESPRVFWEEYKVQSLNQKSMNTRPENWIEDEMAKTFRRIGPALSEKIWKIFNERAYGNLK
ncbi:ERCC4 domain-containing protein [Melampsora americana]|nr:ERCC4 domain-containing protein [Melampsora americana]